MTKAIKFVALGIEHRHIFGMAQNMLDAGAEFAGWWTEGEPDVVEGFVKRFPDVPRAASKEALLADGSIDLVLIADIPSKRADLAIAPEYLELSQLAHRSAAEQEQLAELEELMQERVLTAAPAEIYRLEYSIGGRGRGRRSATRGSVDRGEDLARDAPGAVPQDQPELVAEVGAEELALLQHRVGDAARHDDSVDLRSVLRTGGLGGADHVRGEVGTAHRDVVGA